MLRITQSTSAQASTGYHVSGITAAQASYYTDTGPAVLRGRAARMLGLEGLPVTRENFKALAEGYDV